MKSENREAYSNKTKLQILQDKIKCNDLKPVNSALQVAMGSNHKYTYDEAMSVYRAAWDEIRPPISNGANFLSYATESRSRLRFEGLEAVQHAKR